MTLPADFMVPPVIADYLEGTAALIRNQPKAGAPAPAPTNLADAAMSLVKPFVEQKEGDRLSAYQDANGTWTIGYGHTVGVVPGMTITQAQADAFLAQDLLTFANGVLPLLLVIPGVGQYAALISLAFNIGLAAFKTSTVLRQHNARNPQAAADAFLMWDKAHVDGQLVELPGLLARRQQERAMYLGG